MLKIIAKKTFTRFIIYSSFAEQWLPKAGRLRYEKGILCDSGTVPAAVSSNTIPASLCHCAECQVEKPDTTWEGAGRNESEDLPML
jgi:hypothetical protein